MHSRTLSHRWYCFRTLFNSLKNKEIGRHCNSWWLFVSVHHQFLLAEHNRKTPMKFNGNVCVPVNTQWKNSRLLVENSFSTVELLLFFTKGSNSQTIKIEREGLKFKLSAVDFRISSETRKKFYAETLHCNGALNLRASTFSGHN